MSARRHVRILGSGPAGLMAAITLARSGCSVEVFEKNGDCGGRFNGDLQGLENWTSKTSILDELSSFGLDLNFQHRGYDQTHGITHKGELVRFDLEGPLFYLVQRGTMPGSLDQGLKEQALQLGVDIRFHTRARVEDVDIVAAGPSSREIYILDVGVVFDTDMEDTIYAMADDRNSSKGYSYLLVMNGHGCLCTVLFDRFREIKSQFESVRKTFVDVTGVEIHNERPVSGYGTFRHQGPYVLGGRMYVGEAAGLQDLAWGFGIRYALRSGHLAATCLLEGRSYQLAAEQMFGAGLRAGIVNRCLWEHLGNPGYRLFMSLGQRSKRQRKFLQDFCTYTPMRRMAFPFALRNLRRRHAPLSY